MKKVTILLLLWLAVCLVVLLSPKIASKIYPSPKIIEVKSIRTIAIEKEKIVYRPIENEVLRISYFGGDKEHDEYKIEFVKDFPGGCMLFGGQEGKRDFYASVSNIPKYNHQHPIPELRKEEIKKEPPKQEGFYGQYAPVIIQDGMQSHQFFNNCVSAPTVMFRRLND